MKSGDHEISRHFVKSGDVLKVGFTSCNSSIRPPPHCFFAGKLKHIPLEKWEIPGSKQKKYSASVPPTSAMKVALQLLGRPYKTHVSTF